MSGKHTHKTDEFELRPAFVTLRFRIKDDYDPKTLADQGVIEDDYVTVASMPLREMLTTKPEGLASELLEYMTERKSTRPLAPGDVFYIGEDPWLFVESKTIGLFKGANIVHVKVPEKHARLSIINMEFYDATKD